MAHGVDGDLTDLRENIGERAAVIATVLADALGLPASDAAPVSASTT